MQTRQPVNMTEVNSCLQDFRDMFAIGADIEVRLSCGGALNTTLDQRLSNVQPNTNMFWLDHGLLFDPQGYGARNLSSGIPATLTPGGPHNCAAAPDIADLQAMSQVRGQQVIQLL